jgi:L-rhamnose mutarotase
VKSFGLTLNLKDDPATIAAYKEYHRCVWPEVESSLRRVGINKIEIFLLGRRLFMFMEVTEDFDQSRYVDDYLEEPKALEWENLMKPLQEAVPEAKPGEWWAKMELVYELSAKRDSFSEGPEESSF